MARTMIAAIALMIPLLAGCKGFYVAGDGGAHGARFSAPAPTAPQVTGPPPR